MSQLTSKVKWGSYTGVSIANSYRMFIAVSKTESNVTFIPMLSSSRFSEWIAKLERESLPSPRSLSDHDTSSYSIFPKRYFNPTEVALLSDADFVMYAHPTVQFSILEADPNEIPKSQFDIQGWPLISPPIFKTLVSFMTNGVFPSDDTFGCITSNSLSSSESTSKTNSVYSVIRITSTSGDEKQMAPSQVTTIHMIKSDHPKFYRGDRMLENATTISFRKSVIRQTHVAMFLVVSEWLPHVNYVVSSMDEVDHLFVPVAFQDAIEAI